MFKLNDKVKVSFGIGNWIFESTVVDIVDNERKKGIWVDHPELQGEDMLFVDLSESSFDKAELIEDTIEIEVEENQDIREIKKELQKAVRWLGEDEEVSVKVKIYDSFDDRGSHAIGQTYDVEINLYIDDEYQDGWINHTFNGRYENDEEALKRAKKRAKDVLRIVKGWFKYDDQTTVDNDIEVYNN